MTYWKTVLGVWKWKMVMVMKEMMAEGMIKASDMEMTLMARMDAKDSGFMQFRESSPSTTVSV